MSGESAYSQTLTLCQEMEEHYGDFQAMIEIAKKLRHIQVRNPTESNRAMRDAGTRGMTLLDKRLSNAIDEMACTREIEGLLEDGADPAYENGEGFTFSVTWGRADVLELLIKHDHTNFVKDNWSLLRNAVSYSNKNEEVVKILLQYNNIEDPKVKESIWYPSIKAIADKSI